MTYKTRRAISADDFPERNRVRFFIIWAVQSLYLSVFLFILQHHCGVRMGHKMNARQLPDLFSAVLTFNPSLFCLQSFLVLSTFPRWFWILFPPFNILATSPVSTWNNTVSFSLLYILPEIDHKAVRKPCAYIHCKPTISVYALFILNTSIKKRKRHTVICLIFFLTNHIFTVRTGKKTQYRKTSDPLSHRDMHLWHVWNVCAVEAIPTYIEF